ncbi:E3 ubiquitin-protein ligase RFWD3-like [Salvia splendens]|uniref:E3 ubiquitin-protein ligase RFWD3-like n=1 Tax=Salvia splendens TaxID=180675 RepID=UPI001C256911|nr:E3 ubiquitin-protein ligase RFWD3-like [Salvia splendens]
MSIDPDYIHNMEVMAGHAIELLPTSDRDDEEQDGDDAAGITITTPAHLINDNHGDEVVIVDDTASEDGGDDAAEPERECSSPEKGVSCNKGVSTALVKGDGDDDGLLGEFNRGEIDGLFCPICLEAWTSGGDHHACCLPCGHIYGLSCIKKWLGRQGSHKCPHCKTKCRIKDIRLLYATRLVAIDEHLQKRVISFEAKCSSLEKKSADWGKKEIEWKKREAGLRKEVQYLKERTSDLEDLLEDMERRASGSSASHSNYPRGVDSIPSFHSGGSHKFEMQMDIQIQGARLFGVDSSNKILLFARRLSGMGGGNVLTKVSLISDQEREDIHLAETTKAVKDLKVSPHGGLVLLASLGKKLSVLSTQSNNTVITYDLPASAWSCSWDICNSHYLYAGLQNGTVLQFDMRQTAKHVGSLTGLSDKLVHTMHSLQSDSSCGSGGRSILTASALGLCQLNFGGSEEGSYLIPESDKEGVCVSLACSNYSDYITASFRPKIEVPWEMGVSQPVLNAAGQAIMGNHIVYTKMGAAYQKVGASYGNVSDIRMPIRCAVVDRVYQNPVFACVDELRSEVVIQELPSLMVLERLKPQDTPIYDVKYSSISSSGLVGCLSDNSFRLYSARLLLYP